MTAAALVTAIQARIPDARLKQLTNPKNAAATTTTTSKLTTAATDAISQFPVYVGTVFDSTIQRHLVAGVQVAEAFLLLYAATTTAEAEKRWDRIEKLLTTLSMVEGRDSPSMASNSQVSTTSDRENRPHFDPRHFDGIRADPPVGGETDDPYRPGP